MVDSSTEKRRYSPFSKTLKSCVEPMLRPVFKSQGLAASKLISEWEHIVGRELAAHTCPVKLAFPKDKNSQGTLTVACEGAHAITLQHIQPVIIERIASYFGYKAVERIAIEQRPMNMKQPAKPKASKTSKHVDMTTLTTVEDPELREALSGLAKTFENPTLANS